MSDDKKSNLSDDLEDMIGDVKEGARKAATKAEEFGREAKEKAKEFSGEAREKASEFADDAKKVLSDGKNVAIISHLWIIGWVIALVMNNTNKSDLGTFYIKQTLGIFILSFLAIIPILKFVVGIVCFVLWIMSLIGSLGGEKKPLPIVGDKFQEWFSFV